MLYFNYLYIAYSTQNIKNTGSYKTIDYDVYLIYYFGFWKFYSNFHSERKFYDIS